MKLYITAASAFVLLIFYLPVVLLLLRRIVKSERLGKVAKVAAVSIFLIVAYAIPLGDVTLNSIAMAKVCPKAGLHIYKQVKVDGYFDRLAGEYTLAERPYRFVEGPGPNGKIIHLERSNGQTIRTVLEKPLSEYEVIYDRSQKVQDSRVTLQRLWVRELSTEAPVGEWLTYTPFIGWLDRMLVIRWFGGVLRGCNGGTKMNPDFPFVLLPPK